MEKLFVQVMKFGLTGLVSTIVDFVVFSILNLLWINYVISNIISYICSMIVNYWMSMNFVFVRKDNWSRKKEFIFFVLLSMAGLLINTFTLWILYDIFYKKVPGLKDGIDEHLGKLICKMGATVILLFYNFVSRKIFLEKRD